MVRARQPLVAQEHIYLSTSVSRAIYDYENKVFQEGYGPAVAKRGRQMPSLYEASHNASLMFGNSHYSSGRPVRLPQNYIPIAGYHIDDEVKPLPEVRFLVAWIGIIPILK